MHSYKVIILTVFIDYLDLNSVQDSHREKQDPLGRASHALLVEMSIVGTTLKGHWAKSRKDKYVAPTQQFFF